MYIREAIIEDDKTLGDSGTETTDINIVDPITELIVRFKIQNDTSVTHNTPADIAVDKIELVDGGKTLYSLAGEQAIAAACFDLGQWPDSWYDESASVYQRIAIPLVFGRYLGDPEFGFDPTKLVNPQVKLTYAKNAAHLTGSVRYGLTARIMEGIASPSKCLFWKTVEEFTSASSGVHVVDMWTDNPWRRLAVRARYSGLQLYNILTHYELTCDAGKLQIFDCDQPEFHNIVQQMFGPYEYVSLIRFDEPRLEELWMDGRAIATIMGAETPGVNISGYSSNWSWFWTRAYQDSDGAGVADAKGYCKIAGYFPHSTLGYQFGVPDKPETWFDPRPFGDIDLKLTQGEASATVQVALQQPVTL